MMSNEAREAQNKATLLALGVVSQYKLGRAKLTKPKYTARARRELSPPPAAQAW